jgi:luciferase-like monooxygenase
VIFEFAVRRLKWLAAIPGAPQVFDAMLFTSTALFHPARLRAISTIEKAATEMPGVRAGVHRFGGVGFFFRGKECSHIHGNGLLDCFVGQANRDALLRGRHAASHHVFPRSGWISFWIKDGADVSRALDLIRLACAWQQDAK